MVEIVEKSIPIRIPMEEDCPILLAQVPNIIRHHHFLYQVADPDRKWAMVRPILEMVAASGFNRARFVVFPEASIPFRYKDEILQLIESRFPPNTVVIFGFEHILFSQYCQLLNEYLAFNEEACELVCKRRQG
jgi:hypothetical protein